MNAQNIPSHATDIRHLFRATPSHSVVMDFDCTDDQDSLCIDVDLLYRVTVQGKGEVTVKDLVIGDIVKILEDGKEIYCKIKEIVTDVDSHICHIVFCK